MKKYLFVLTFCVISLLNLNSTSIDSMVSNVDFLDHLKTALNGYNQELPQEKIYLHLDKPFYVPGDDIWIKAYLVDGTNNQSSLVSEIVYIELINPKGSVEKTLNLIAKGGTTHGEFKLSQQAAGGIYKVRAYTNWMRNYSEGQFFEREIQVQSVLLPRLLMNLEFQRKSYGPGDEVIAKLKLSTLENIPLTNKAFNYRVHLQGQEFKIGTHSTDDLGTASVSFGLPNTLDSTDGLLNIIIEHEGSNESISRSIPIVLNKISLQFFPEGGDLISNVNSKVAFKATNEFGKPADISGIIINEDGEAVTSFKSYHNGMGTFTLEPKGDEKYYAQLTQPESTKKFLVPAALSKGYRIKAMAKNTSQIKLDIHSPITAFVNIVAQVRGKIYYSEQIKVNMGSNNAIIPTKRFPVGIAQISLFDHNGIPRCERLLFVNQHKDININISTDKEKYQPREKVEMTVQVSDEDGLPMSANLSLSVVDDKLISFADDKKDNILSYLLLSSDVKGAIDEPNFYFKKDEPKANEALDNLLMTQGWRRFVWSDITEATPIELQQQINYKAEKAIVEGTVVKFRHDTPIENAKVTVLETEEFTYTNSEGKFKFDSLDLTTPLTLQATTIDGFSRIQQINDYSIGYQIGDHVSGLVLNEQGDPIPGVNVLIKGTMLGTTTNFDGTFSLKTPQGSNTVIFSFIGLTPQEVSIQNHLEITMERENVQLFEMVVLGMGVDRKRKEVKNNDIDKALPAIALPEIIEIADEEELIADLEFGIAEEVVLENVIFDEDWGEEMMDNTFDIVEEMPEPHGGMKKFYNYLSKNINYPDHALKLGIQGKVFVQFIIDTDGSVNDVHVVKGIGAGCDTEASRLIEKSPKWRAGKQRGTAVKTRMILPVTFNIDNYVADTNGLMLKVANESAFSLRTQEAKYHRARIFYAPNYEAKEPVKVRDDFRQTIFWEPNLLVDKTGKAKVSFYNSDEITTFRTTVEGIGTRGAVGRSEFTYHTQLPFSLSTKLPSILSFGDEPVMSITLKNSTEEMIDGILEIELPKALKLLQTWEDRIKVDPNSTETVLIPYRVLSTAGSATLAVSFVSEGLSDSFEQTIEIKPKGFPISQSFSGKALEANYQLKINDLVENTLKAKLTVYPDILSDLMGGIESILREPYGCFEQTSSSTYPNIIALQYMEETGTLNKDIRDKALSLIDKGYQKLTAFETKNKGYEWFGQTPPHEGLTAYGLMEFSDMTNVYPDVSKEMVSRTSDWILSRRDGLGGFKRSDQALDGFGRASQQVSNAYILYALSESGIMDIEPEYDKSLKSALANKDPYELALIANTSFNLKKETSGKRLVDALLSQISSDGYGDLKADHSITRSSGKSLQVETASLIVLAMLKSKNPNIGDINDGINFLLTSRSNYGGFGSTQATVLALKALTQYAKLVNTAKTNGDVEVFIGKRKIATKHYTEGARDEIVIDGLEEFLKEGSHEISVKFKNTNEALPYSLDIDWSTYTPASDSKCQVKLTTELSTNSVKLGQTVRMTSTIQNLSADGLPMTTVLIGIPSGLSPQPWQLKELQDRKIIDYYEVNKNYVVLYFRQLMPNAEHKINLDLKSEIRGVFQSPASTAYLYYTNELKSWTGGEIITIL